MAYLVLVLQVFQVHLLNANIFLHLIKAVGELEGLVQGKPIWIYSNLVIIILYAWMMQNAKILEIYRNDKHASIVKISTD